MIRILLIAAVAMVTTPAQASTDFHGAFPPMDPSMTSEERRAFLEAWRIIKVPPVTKKLPDVMEFPEWLTPDVEFEI